ncbi:MAG: tripartite tricarboxylate transporter substrate binding protein [Rhizobiaceae bacterium]|nr:tripartite tricarboxylate transporter substrate binding protein [Rhizobiaceae bacterium]
MAEKLRERLGVSFLVENRPGAGGNIGVQAAAHAAPDGYTFVVGTISTHAVNPVLSEVPFDPEKDFVGIGGIIDTPNVLFVRSGLGIENTQQLIDYLKEHPGELFFGSTGAGSSQYIAAELLQDRSGTSIKHVTYQGAGDIMTALLGGHLDMAFNTAIASIPFLENDAVKALGVTSASRIKLAPDLPTLSETIPGFETGAWAGIWAPAETPAPIVAKLSETLGEIISSAEFAAEAEKLGAYPIPLTGKEFDAFVAGERTKWAQVLKKN